MPLSPNLIHVEILYSRDKSSVKQCRKRGFLGPLIDVCLKFPSNLPA